MFGLKSFWSIERYLKFFTQVMVLWWICRYSNFCYSPCSQRIVSMIGISCSSFFVPCLYQKYGRYFFLSWWEMVRLLEKPNLIAHTKCHRNKIYFTFHFVWLYLTAHIEHENVDVCKIHVFNHWKKQMNEWMKINRTGRGRGGGGNTGICICETTVE